MDALLEEADQAVNFPEDIPTSEEGAHISEDILSTVLNKEFSDEFTASLSDESIEGNDGEHIFLMFQSTALPVVHRPKAERKVEEDREEFWREVEEKEDVGRTEGEEGRKSLKTRIVYINNQRLELYDEEQ
jgi:hypothetical protein